MTRHVLFILMFGGMFLPASAIAAGSCGAAKPAPTKITIDLSLPKPHYDLDLSIREINKNHSADDWIARNGMQKVWKSSEMTTLGYAEGAMGIAMSAHADLKPYDRYGVYYCPYIRDLDLSMIFRTRIVIPNNFKNGGCRFNTVHEHEYRHYMANREVAEKFVKRLYKDLPVIIGEIENRQPYIEGKDVPAAIEMMRAGITDAIESYIFQAIAIEAARRNNLIDTPEEYASAAPKMAACAD